MASKNDIPLIGPLLNRLIGSRNDRFVKRYTTRVNQMNAFEPQIRKLTDAEIFKKVDEFRARHDKGEKSDEIMIEAFAVAREAMDRAVGIRNIFNPKLNFDASRLSAAMRDLYTKIKAQAEAIPDAAPEGEWQGNAQPVPGWMQVPIPVEMYDAVRELYPESRPPFRARPFDVQLIGGMVLGQGKISEMKTGEGKTIVGPLACYMAAIERFKVHVVTVNDYLVQRDRDWTFPYFHALGLTVGAIHPQHMQDENEKRVMYRCDVVYGTTAEFGFDYLRDQMKRRADEQVQKRREFAIVDEVDSILIDEARTPLIISGQAHDYQPRYDLADKVARHLVDKQRPWDLANEQVEKCKMRIKGAEGDIRQSRDKSKLPEIQKMMSEAKAELPRLEAARDKHTQYFEVKPERKSAHLTHDGITEAQRSAGVGSLYVDQNIDLPHLLEQAVRAYAVYVRDKDYIVMDSRDPQTGRMQPSIVIVDVNTGRPMVGRQWSDGLHQAIECKERVPIKEETQTVATVTIQNFFKMYKRLAGMTGTADTEAQEFHDIYKLDVVAIPTNREVIRRDFDDMVFLTGKDKWAAITDEIKNFHDCGRPVLVGTTSVEKSESLGKMLTARHAVQHEVLNAKQHEREATIVENAGQLGAVMIATNMAGRGTDIKLGKPTREALLDHWLRRGIAPRTLTVESTDEQLREAIYRKIASKELDLQKKDAETMAFPELEIQLLRHWASKNTWLDPKQIERSSADELREALDHSGRFLLHRIRWFNTIEDMGGLHVVGTERHEARRIDNQLRGRSGRQGDNGSTRFFVALDDELMKMFAGDATMRILSRLGMKEGDAIEHPMLSKSVERAQRKVEERNFQIRKQVLEYDEVMEHQRQYFYSMRQRALEGRDVKGLLFDFIQSTVDNAVGEYLDSDYPFITAAEYTKAKLDCSIAHERLRGKQLHEMEAAIVGEALYEMRQNIDVTLGEFMPMEGSDVQVDFDPSGLIAWAKSKFGVELSNDDVKEGTAAERKRILDILVAASSQKIRTTDLSGLSEFLAPNYGAARLSEWCMDKLSMEISAEEIVNTNKKASDTGVSVTNLLMKRVEEKYRRREVEYPVEFIMGVTTMLMRQNPQEAADQLLAWANQRFGFGWTREIFKTLLPQQMREQLTKASEQYVNEGKLEKAIAQAQKCATDADLEKHFQDTYGRPWPETSWYLHGQERLDAVRSRVENILRSELLHFERTIVLEVLDQAWKDHLYAMDQLRDSINYRAFSQQDPRIEYKREGSMLFHQMLDAARERITEYVFKARISPTLPGGQSLVRPGGMPPPPRRPAPPESPSLPGGGMITGPGFA
jgi:preprotein translocase subunit SecA